MVSLLFHFALPFLWVGPGASFHEPPFCSYILAVVSFAASRGRRASARPAFPFPPAFPLCSSDVPLAGGTGRIFFRSRKTGERRQNCPKVKMSNCPEVQKSNCQIVQGSRGQVIGLSKKSKYRIVKKSNCQIVNLSICPN